MLSIKLDEAALDLAIHDKFVLLVKLNEKLTIQLRIEPIFGTE